MGANVSNTSHSTIGDLCQELEALRLNASMSPLADNSPLASHSSKFLAAMREKQLEASLLSPVKGQVSDVEAEVARAQLSYILQSCRVAGKRVADVLADLAQDLESDATAKLSVTKAIRNKLRPEIVCLRDVLSKCEAFGQQNPGGHIDFSFVHILTAARATEVLLENCTSSDIFVLSTTVKVVVQHLESNLAESSSEDESDSPDIRRGYTRKFTSSDTERKDIKQHTGCILHCLDRTLQIAYNNCNTDMFNKKGEAEILKSKLLELGECGCLWRNCKSEEIYNNLNANSGDIYNNINNNVRDTPKRTVTQSAPRYNKAFSFLKDTLFSEKKNIENSNLDSKNSNGEIIKKLSFDEEDAISVTLSAKDGLKVSKVNTKVDNENIIANEINGNDKAVEEITMEEKEEFVDDASDDESFASANSSIDDAMLTPEEGVKVYLSGLEPSKVDMDVLVVLEGRDIDEVKYPFISQWMQLIDSHSQEQRTSWASPYCRSSSRRALPTPTSLPSKLISSTPISAHRGNISQMSLSGTPEQDISRLCQPSAPRNLFNMNSLYSPKEQ
ncbi:unnamed protein product [Meganyctiphanes norvegica]|uniref:Uncharacterized protein n=1 Tax=Meganyctiphanes norvegica TaxID=48144 RepID=A0AAV2QK20_MEGNR